MASAVDSRLAYARLSAVATASRLPTATRGSNNSYTTSWDTTDLRPWYVQRRKELENRPLIRAQAFGQSLDPDKLSRLARYEVHLDRKLERTLAMLLRLQDLRRETGE